jgi:hypothetical protein
MGGKTGVYGGELVRNMHGNLYLSMDMATEYEVADTKGSTATLWLAKWAIDVAGRCDMTSFTNPHTNLINALSGT